MDAGPSAGRWAVLQPFVLPHCIYTGHSPAIRHSSSSHWSVAVFIFVTCVIIIFRDGNLLMEMEAREREL